MSTIQDKFNLRAGMFGLCSGYWDKKTNRFRRADDTEEEIVVYIHANLSLINVYNYVQQQPKNIKQCVIKPVTTLRIM